jgi:hypothetical protein
LILGEQRAEVSLAEDQHAIGEFGSDGQDEALGEAVRPRATRRDLDHLDTRIRQHRVKRPGELTGAIADQEQRPMTGLASGPGRGSARRGPGEADRHEPEDRVLEAASAHHSRVWRACVLNYATVFYPSAVNPIGKRVDRHLVRWARRKYKRLERSEKRARDWLSVVRTRAPDLFAHWALRY